VLCKRAYKNAIYIHVTYNFLHSFHTSSLLREHTFILEMIQDMAIFTMEDEQDRMGSTERCHFQWSCV